MPRRYAWKRWGEPFALFALIAFFSFTVTGCDGFFPSQTKIGTPDDHTDAKGRGAMHKAESEHPFTEEAGCSASDCHQEDLRGGFAEVDGRPAESPSCYQCHDENWDDDEDENEDEKEDAQANAVTAPITSHVTTRL